VQRLSGRRFEQAPAFPRGRKGAGGQAETRGQDSRGRDEKAGAGAGGPPLAPLVLAAFFLRALAVLGARGHT